MSERSEFDMWRDTISAMDEFQLITWTWDMEKFIHYIEVPRGMDIDEAKARHREHNLRPLLEALQSLPPTPTRQAMIDDLVEFHFKAEGAGDAKTVERISVPYQHEPPSPEDEAYLRAFYAQHNRAVPDGYQSD